MRGEPRPDGLHEGLGPASAAPAVLLLEPQPGARLPMKRLGGERGPDPRTVSGDRGQRGRTGLPLGRLEWSGMGDDTVGHMNFLYKNRQTQKFSI